MKLKKKNEVVRIKTHRSGREKGRKFRKLNESFWIPSTQKRHLEKTNKKPKNLAQNAVAQ